MRSKNVHFFSIFATFQLFFLLTFNKLFWLWQKAGKIAENSSAEIEFRCWLSSVCKCPNPKSSCVGWLEFFTHFPAFFVFLPICNFPHFLNVKKNYKIGGKFKLPKSGWVCSFVWQNQVTLHLFCNLSLRLTGWNKSQKIRGSLLGHQNKCIFRIFTFLNLEEKSSF